MKLLNAIPLVCAVLVFPANAAEKTISFLHINDLHAHLTPHKDLVADGIGGTKVVEKGGFARLATLIKQQQVLNPDNVVMNIGDTFHGGVEALFSLGNAIVEPVNALGIDVGVAGNWDFAYSPGLTRMRFGPLPEMPALIELPGIKFDTVFPIRKPNYPNLGANITDIVMPTWDFMPATHAMVVNGVKVGFIGLTSDIVDNMHIFMAIGFVFTEGEDNYRQLINDHANQLRNDGAEIVVVMSELGIHKDHKLANIVEPGLVDVFFSAHTHEATFEPLVSDSGALVVEAGNDGWLGRMNITYDDVAGAVTSREWALLAVDDQLAEDAAMKALVDAARAPYLDPDVDLIAPPFMLQTLKQPINTVIGHTDTLIHRKDALESSFNNALTDKMLEMTGADVAMTPGFRFDKTIAEPGYMYEDGSIADGEITLEDVFRFFPVAYLLAEGRITGGGLREVIEDLLTSVFSPDAFNHQGGWMNGFAGIDVDVDLAAPDGQRVQSIRFTKNGEELAVNESIRVAGCWRIIDTPNRLCSIKGFTGVHPLFNPTFSFPPTFPPTSFVYTAQDAFVDSLVANNLNGLRVSITDSASTPRWPIDAFIQPLKGVGDVATAAVPPGTAPDAAPDTTTTVLGDHLEEIFAGALSPWMLVFLGVFVLSLRSLISKRHRNKASNSIL